MNPPGSDGFVRRRGAEFEGEQAFRGNRPVDDFAGERDCNERCVAAKALGT